MSRDHQSIPLTQNLPSISTNSNSANGEETMSTIHWKCRFLFGLTILITLAIFFSWFLFAQPPQYASYTSFEFSSGSSSTGHSTVLVLVWTRIFREMSFGPGEGCPYFNRCIFTYDPGELPQADAIVYHVPDIKWTGTLNPTTMNIDLPEMPVLPPMHLAKKTVANVFLTQENPSSLEQFYKFKDLPNTTGNFFHWTMTYLNSSDLPMPYGGYWLNPEETRRWGFAPVRLPSDSETILRDKKTKGIVWFVSNCDSHSKRELAVEALSKYIPVTIGGKCAKTKDGKQMCPRGDSCDHFFAEHYFYIAAENDICIDYISEKYWSRYQLPSVPIVMRKHIYDRRVPDNSFIAMDQFESPKAMADHLHLLMSNTSEYMKYFEWRAQNWTIAPWYHEHFLMGPCALCKRLLSANSAQPQQMENAAQWFERESHCEGGEFARQWSKL